MNRDEMVLGAFFFNPQGDHRMSWRHPFAPGKEIFGVPYFQQLAQTAQSGYLDMLFVADHVAMWDSYESNIAHYANARLEPVTLLSALSAVTHDIGLIGTVSASYSEPYNTARLFSSLDHLSQGRAGWNVVTSGMDEEAMNFGRDANLEHRYRYERAAEYLEVVELLWDSWEDEAVVLDKASGQFAEPTKVHRIDHRGQHFRVRGPLNVPRSPQGRPLIAQAGASDDGKNLAARYADLHFTRYRGIDDGRAYRQDFNLRLAKYGKSPEDIRILPGLQPIIGRSASEAQEKREYLETLVPERMGVDLVSSWCGVDVSAMPPDGPLPSLPDEANYNGQRTNLVRMRALKEQNKTIREVAKLLSNVGGAHVMAGTPTDIADEMESWYRAGVCDGFVLMFPVLPSGCMEFVSEVIPELQRRGVAQSRYRSGTLREKLGLRQPRNRFVKSSVPDQIPRG
ncbi:monooxygenase [Burkholderia sp. THE68]|uniref:LLM class flavin-dependent oxidoreductase n=1 Tax=Burkholderia sp. THE68 TaxID=758782 RepID=UPI0013194D66|nr:LLM class flavin-dependent oxidoreductase [Burkholderia sp. THE68]BBU30290.1 monooxygenase [Burkholderia sp. THE68]